MKHTMPTPANAAPNPVSPTPGEWTLEYDGSLVMAGQVIDVSNLGPDIASRAEKKANARLLSTPPNLLLAARSLVAFLHDLDRTHCGLEDYEATYPGLIDSWKQASDAIAKATGE